MVKYVDVTLRIALEDNANANVALEEANWMIYQSGIAVTKESGILDVYFIDARKVREKEL